MQSLNGDFFILYGTSGGHWALEQTTAVAKSNEIEFKSFNEYDWRYVMNMIYSDYYGSVQNDVDVYAKTSKKFLQDKDSKDGKAYRYWLAMK